MNGWLSAATLAAVDRLDDHWRDALTPIGEATYPWPTGNTGWWRTRLDNTAQRWGAQDPRVNATLWWYSASHTWARLIAVPLLVGDATVAPEPDGGLWLRDTGYLGGPLRLVPVPRVGAAAALVALSAPMIDDLATVGGATRPALRAILGDSIVTCLLNAAAQERRHSASSHLPTVAASLAADLAAESAAVGMQLPRPRFVDVGADGRTRDAEADQPVPAGWRRFGRRSSCCLIYQTPGHGHDADDGKCGTCPRLTAPERAARMARHVA